MMVLGLGLLLSSVACKEPDAAPPLYRHPYEAASRSRVLQFPADHGPHREAAYEWWYFTGHQFAPPTGAAEVEGARGAERAGFEVTVFRLSPSAGSLPADAAAGRPERASFLSLHVAASDLLRGTFRHYQLALRERPGVAEVSSQPGAPLTIVLPGTRIELDATGQRFSVDSTLAESAAAPLRIRATLASHKPVTLHGERGYSWKGGCETCASHYSSFPRLSGSATVQLGPEAPSSGPAQAWFDHEFGSNSLAGGQVGWDWFALQLDDGWEVMLDQMRDKSGATLHRFGSLIAPTGEVTPIPAAAIELVAEAHWTSPHTGARYPSRWRVRLLGTAHPLDVTLVPRLPDQELYGGGSSGSGLATYWEGTCEVLAAGGARSLGTSFVEMTGYDEKGRPRF